MSYNDGIHYVAILLILYLALLMVDYTDIIRGNFAVYYVLNVEYESQLCVLVPFKV